MHPVYDFFLLAAGLVFCFLVVSVSLRQPYLLHTGIRNMNSYFNSKTLRRKRGIDREPDSVTGEESNTEIFRFYTDKNSLPIPSITKWDQQNTARVIMGNM